MQSAQNDLYSQYQIGFPKFKFELDFMAILLRRY